MLYYTLKTLDNTEKIASWKSKGLSAQKFTSPITTIIVFPHQLNGIDSNFCLFFKGSCLKQKSASYTPLNRINLFTVYELDTQSRDLNSDFILKDYLFGGVKLAKNYDPDKYVYTGYDIGFDIDLAQGSDNTKLSAEAQYSVNLNLSRSNRKFCLSLHYNETNSNLFVNATKIYHFKAKHSETKKHPLYLGNISGYFSANNMKKQD